MFVVETISQLIGYTFCTANLYIYIVMRMPVYPVFYTAIFYVVLQFSSEGSVCFTAGKFRVLHAERGDMMRNNYFMVSPTNNHLPIVFRCPVSKRMAAVILISEITDISGQDKNVPCNRQRIMFDVAAVIGKSQMQVGSVLNFHVRYYDLIANSPVG